MAEQHHFEVDEAVKYGIEKAVLLYNIRWWLKKNKANNANVKDGYYWTYNSSKAFAKLFPYLNMRSIRRWLQDLEDEGVILSANYNLNPYDNTKWYTIPAEFSTRGQNGQGSIVADDHSSGQDGQSTTTEFGQSITDINSDTNPDSKHGGVDENSDLKKENTENTDTGGGELTDLAISEHVKAKVDKWKQTVIKIGRTTYTRQMLDNFIGHWAELDLTKRVPRMRWEGEDAFEITKRLSTWARRNLDRIQCYLTDEQKSLEQKKVDFQKTLEPYRKKYGREVLNKFYQHWSEVKPGTNIMKFEQEEYWEVGLRLAKWRKDQPPPPPQTGFPQREKFD